MTASRITAGQTGNIQAGQTDKRLCVRLDFTHPSTYLPIGYLIPKPELTVSLTSIVKPFSNEVYFR